MVDIGTLSSLLSSGAWRGTAVFAEVPQHFSFFSISRSEEFDRYEFRFFGNQVHGYPVDHAKVCIPCSRLQDETSIRNMFTRSKIVDILFG